MFSIINHKILLRKIHNQYGRAFARSIKAIIESGNYTPGLWSLVTGKPIFSNKIGAIGEKLKYGHIKGFELFIPVPIGASEVVSAASGRFVKSDASGRAEIAGDGDTELIGHLEAHAHTASATEGADSYPVNIAIDAVYRIPVISGTYAAAMRWDTTDIIVTSDIQGVQLAASAEDTVQIIDGDETNNNWVDVRLNPNKLAVTGAV